MAISSREWLAVLLNENGASYYLDTNGQVKSALTPKPLTNMFEGWLDIVLNYGRSAKYIGLERTYTSTYTFTKDGADILRYLLFSNNNRGVENRVYIGLLKWNGDTNDNYELFYKAEIDLLQAVNDPKRGITVEVMQDGPAKYLKANESIKYSIPCSGLTLNLDGVRLTQTLQYQAADINIQAYRYAMPITLLSSSGQAVGVTFASQDFQEFDTTGEVYAATTGNYFFKSFFGAVGVNFSGTLKVANLESATTTCAIGFYCSDGTRTLLFESTIPGNTTLTLSINEYIVVPVNHSLCMLFTQILELNTVSFVGTDLTVSFDTRFQITPCAAKRPVDLFKELISELTDGRFTGVSTLLEENKHLVATSGDAIRGVANPLLKTSIMDFFSFYGTRLHGAMGVNYDTQEVLFESRTYFLDNDIEIIDLGEVSDLTIEVAKDHIFNSIKVGYPSQKADEAVAKEEVNAQQIYRTPITRIQKELDLTTVYRTDIFGIEDIRQRFYDQPNTDSTGDNDVFVINIERTEDIGGGWNVYRADYSAISGGANLDTWYNIEQLTPHRVIAAMGSYIRGCMWALGTELIKFISGDKNTGLITTLAGVTTVEAGNFRINSFADPYHTPFLIKFTTKIPENVVSLLQQAGRGYVTGTWQGARFYGFPQELGVKPVFDEAQEWTLLSSSKTDPAIFATLSNQGLIIEDMGIISHKLPVKLLRVDETYSLANHFRQMDTDLHQNRIARYSTRVPYFQPWQINDTFDVQFITQGLSASLTLIDKNQRVLKTYTLTQTANPAVSNPKQLYLGTVNFTGLEARSTVYLLATFGSGPGVKQFVSEPMILDTDWADSLLIGYSNSRNQTDMIWKLTGGAMFSSKMRIPGYIQKFRPGGRLTQYEDQPLDLVNLDNEPIREYELLLEEIPDWVADKVNRIMMLDTVTIDGFAYTLGKDAKLEPMETTGSSLASWATVIREAYNKAGIAIDAEGEDASVLTVEYNINTKGFSSNQSPANQQDTIIQVTEIE